jgi:hypothetical protein
MPMNLKDYPPDWKAFSHRIRFDRAGGKCEFPGCTAEHLRYVPRTDKRGNIKLVRVILTVAHLCDCRPICSNDQHVLALCQAHHLGIDGAKHRRNSAATRRAKSAERGQGFLIGDIDK